MDDVKNKFDELLEENGRSKKIRKQGILLFIVALLTILVGLLFGFLPGIGFAIVFSYAVNKIVEKPKKRRP